MKNKLKFITVDFFIQATLLVLIILSYIIGESAIRADYLRFLLPFLIHFGLCLPYQFLISNTIHSFFIKKSCESRLEKGIRFFRLSVLILAYSGYFLEFSRVIHEPPGLWLDSSFDNGLTFGCIKDADQFMGNLYLFSIPISIIYFFVTCFEFSRSNAVKKGASANIES